MLALASMAGVLPQVFVSPFAGALVDRWNRRLVMMLSDLAAGLATAALAVLFATGVVQVWHIYALLAVRAVGGAFHWPAMQASTSLMVPEQHLSRVAGLNQMLWGAANIVAPPLGALLLTALPMQGMLAIDIVTAAIAISPLLFITIPQPERAPTGATTPRAVLADMGEGLRFVLSWRGMMTLIGLAMLINLLAAPAFSLLPILVTEHFGGGAAQFAAMQSAQGIGVVVGGLLLSAWGGFRKRIVTAGAGLIVMGAGFALIGLTPSNLLIVAIGALFVAGMMNPIVNGSIFAVMQATVPPEKQGRVFTLLQAGAMAMMPLGLGVAGPLADAVGAPFWFVLAGAITAAAGVAGFFMPAMMNIEEDGHTVAASTAAASADAPMPRLADEAEASATAR